MNQRYYFSRKPSQLEGGAYKIFDRVLDLRVASCDFKENAELLCRAANELLRMEAENKTLKLQITQLLDSLSVETKAKRAAQNEASRLAYPDTTGS